MKSLLLAFFVAVVAIQACGTTHSDSNSQLTEKYPDGEIPFPEIPSDITDPLERAEYVLMHFWDDFDFANHELSLDSTFMEKNFANYSQFYAYVPDTVAEKCVEAFLDKAQASPESLRFAAGIASDYLGDRQSPCHNETAFIYLLESMMKRDAYSPSETLRAKYALEQAKKNRPGMAAADFTFETRDGNTTSLYTCNHSPYTLLVFYSPTCDTCHEMIEQVTANGEVTGLVDRGIVSVVAIAADDDRPSWEKTKREMPAKWIVGYDTEGIVDREVYVYDFPPSIYLLDRTKHVILKEPTLTQLIDYAHRN